MQGQPSLDPEKAAGGARRWVEPAIARHQGEADRLADVVDADLGRNERFAGNDRTIADMARSRWFRRRDFAGFSFVNRPNLARRYTAGESRPAVQRGIAATLALAEAAAKGA